MPTDAYYRALAATKKLHAGEKMFSGRFLVRYLDDIRAIIAQYRVKTMLDYGCGRAVKWEDGTLAKELGVEVTLYDPGVPRFETEPVGSFDMVICTQALGSIPVSDIEWAIDRLDGYARSAVYIGERLGPVRKKLHKDMAAEGAMPHEWTHDQWVGAVATRARGCSFYVRTTDKRAGVSRMEEVE